MLEVLLAGLIFGADQLIKHRIDRAPESSLDRPLAGGRFIVTRFHNEGALLGFLKEQKSLLDMLSGAAAAGLAVSLLKAVSGRAPLLKRISLSLAAGGAASNMYDRALHGRVTDYFRITFLGRRMKNVIFNIGDIAIITGAFLETAGQIRSLIRQDDKC
jgi:signal peptidase II